MTTTTPMATDASAGSDRSARWAALTFAAAVVVAVPVIFHAARTQWFFLDEWDLLADRDLMSPDDLLRPHNEHWSTLPIVAYRLVWQVVGLHHYWPYLAMTVVCHLAVAVMIRVVARRAGADPWTSTAVATLFAYLGAGWENIGWAFQVGFTGALAAGYGAVLLADHDGGRRWRDVAAAVAATAALMSSGIGTVMLAVLGLSVLLRRGVLAALAIGAAPAAVLVAWTLGYGDAEATSGGDVWTLVRDIVLETGRALGPWGAVGLLLTVAAIVGCGLRVAREGWAGTRRGLAPPFALLVGAVAFVVLVAAGRAALSAAAQSRYVHVLAALTFPAVAIGLSELGRRWRPAGIAAVVLLVAALVPNIDAMGPAPFTRGSPDTVVALAHAAATLPDEGVTTELDPTLWPGVDVPWLQQVVADGKVPDLADGDRALVPGLQLRMGFHALAEPVVGDCLPVDVSGQVRLVDGDVLVARGASVRLVVLDGVLPEGTSAEVWPPVGAAPGPDGQPEVRLRRDGSPVGLQVEAVAPTGPVVVCPG